MVSWHSLKAYMPFSTVRYVRLHLACNHESAHSLDNRMVHSLTGYPLGYPQEPVPVFRWLQCEMPCGLFFPNLFCPERLRRILLWNGSFLQYQPPERHHFQSTEVAPDR